MGHNKCRSETVLIVYSGVILKVLEWPYVVLGIELVSEGWCQRGRCKISTLTPIILHLWLSFIFIRSFHFPVVLFELSYFIKAKYKEELI